MDVPKELSGISVAVEQVLGKLTFPISDQEQGARSLGEDAPVEYEGRQYTVEELRRLIPASYFPIESEPDLIMKIADLEMRHPDRAEMFTPKPGEVRSPSVDLPAPVEVTESDAPPAGAEGPTVKVKDTQPAVAGGVGIFLGDTNNHAPINSAWFNTDWYDFGDGNYFIYQVPADGWLFCDHDHYLSVWFQASHAATVIVWMVPGTEPPPKKWP